MTPCTGVILAGGKNSRFGGCEKALATVGGKPVIDRIHAVLAKLFEEVILGTSQHGPYLERDLTIVTDIHRTRSSLTGIHAALFYASSPHVFVTACDTPFIRAGLVGRILDDVDPRMDAFIPETGGGLEPLCAVYAKKALPAVEHNLQRGQYRIIRVFRRDRIKKIPEKVLRRYDPELISFYNMNTPEKRTEAETLARRIAIESPRPGQ